MKRFLIILCAICIGFISSYGFSDVGAKCIVRPVLLDENEHNVCKWPQERQYALDSGELYFEGLLYNVNANLAKTLALNKCLEANAFDEGWNYKDGGCWAICKEYHIVCYPSTQPGCTIQ